MLRDPRSAEILCKQRGRECYATFTKDERTLVQFGMFPADKATACDAACVKELTLADGDEPDERDRVDIARWTAVGMMDAANAV